jgi:hypothetical protein
VHVSEKIQRGRSMTEGRSLLQKSSLNQVATVSRANTGKETTSALSYAVGWVECVSLWASGLQKGECGGGCWQSGELEGGVE